MKRVKWSGFGTREIHGYVFENGTIHDVEDDNLADDMLTQPNEDFEEIEVKKPTRRGRKKKEEEVKKDN